MIFALADCNNFYVSCERVFNRRLHGRPVVVLSSNDGCVISRSAEAKALGITMGLPVFKAREIISRHNVAVLSSNYALYGSMSRRVMDVLATFNFNREVYSIDEAFLELPDLDETDAVALCETMRARVLQWTGIPISIGIGPTKTLAKLANRLVKQAGSERGVVSVLDSVFRKSAMVKFPVADVWGVGHGIRKALELTGIKTAAQLRDADTFWMKKEFGIKGLALVLELQGQVCHRLGSGSLERNEIIVTRTFGKHLKGFDQLAPAFREFAKKGAERLKASGMMAKSVTAYLVMDRFRPDYQGGSSVELEMEAATADVDALTYIALEALQKLPIDERNYKKGGVIFSKLTPAGVIQETFFGDLASGDNAASLQSFRKITITGLEAVRSSADGIHRQDLPVENLWEQRREHMSPRFTTQWSELPVVR